MEEICKDISGYEDIYQVSNFWKIIIKNYRWTWKQRIIKSSNSKEGYMRVNLIINWIIKWFSVHRLVAINFIPNPDNYPVVMHLDNNKSNNNITNLKWWTQSQNIKQCFNEWRANNNFQLNHPRSKVWLWKFWEFHNWAKKVYQYWLNWEFVREWWSIMDATRFLNIDSSSISKWCRWKVKTAWWFIWKYEYTNLVNSRIL